MSRSILVTILCCGRFFTYHIYLFQQQQFPTLQIKPACLRRSNSAIALRRMALVLFGAFQDQFSTERTVFQRQLECDCRPVGTLLYRKFLSKILSNCSRTSRKLVILRSYNKFWKDFQKVLSQKAWIWLDILCLRRIYSNEIYLVVVQRTSFLKQVKKIVKKRRDKKLFYLIQ